MDKFNLGDIVYEKGTDIRGVIMDYDEDMDTPYGVLFDDVDEDEGIWWCDQESIYK